MIEQRLRVQRLISEPLPRAVDAVRLLTCVQAQDAPLAALSLGLRCAGIDYPGVLDEQRTGCFVRTHILRPTWHYVAAEDLRWILALTSPRVERSLAGRHRQLGLDSDRIEAALRQLQRVLGDGRPRTRRDLAPHLLEAETPRAGEVVGHLLLVAELRGLICSGPPRPATATVAEHTYTLVEAVVPPSDPIPADEATRLLVHRFFAGHGPATDRDLARWCSLTLTTIRPR